MKNTEFVRLYRQHYQFVRARCQRLAGSVPDLDDLVQEVFLLAYRAFERFEDRGESFSRWVSVIARNVVINWLRRRWREQPDLTVIERLDASSAQTEVEVEIPRHVQAALAGLTEAHLRVLELVAEGHRVTEIAVMLGISAKTVGTRIFRARQRIRKAILTA